MAIYRVYGDKVHSYYTDVSASDPDQAYQIAESRESVDWNEMENDEVIEISEVILDEQN